MESYMFYVRDLFYAIRETADGARGDVEDGGEHLEFHRGREMALIEVLSTMKNQAVSFGLDLDALEMANFDPFRDTLRPPSR